MLKDLSVKEFVKATGSGTATPGGGSVVALAAAQGAALLEMVANLTIANQKYEKVHDEMRLIAEKCRKFEEDFIEDIDKDTNSFNDVIAAFHMPKDSEEDKKIRSAKIQEGYKKATDAPLEVGIKTLKLLDTASILIEKGNPNAISDAAVGLLNIRLATKGAFYNVKTNLKAIKDKDYVDRVRLKMKNTLKEIDDKITPLLEEIDLRMK